MSLSVLVMGGSYFIGKRIVEAFLEHGYCVYTLNRGTRPCEDFRVKQINCDRNDKERMQSLLKAYEFDIVIDVCGLNQIQAEVLCSALNLETVKKFLFISSSAVYDVENLEIPFVETDGLEENTYWTSYGKNKILAEEYYTCCFTTSKTDLIILRPPYVYGEDNYAQRESFIFEHIDHNRPILIPSSNCKLQFINALDLATIVLSLIEKQTEKISIFNVGNKDVVTSKEWVELCAKVAKKPASMISYDWKKQGRSVRDFFPFFDYDNVLDVSKINQFVSVEMGLEMGLAQSYEWYLKNKEKIVFKEDIRRNECSILKQIGGYFF